MYAQIPNPELGPLERRVSLTYLEALSDDHVRQEDIDYWFNEPEGVCMRIYMLIYDHTPRWTTGGWNRPPLELPFAEEVDVGEPTTGAHPGEGRTPIQCFKVGDIIEGQVSAMMYLYGALIDFGADFDGCVACCTTHVHVYCTTTTIPYSLVPVIEKQWTEEINELLDVGAPVKARIHAIRDTEWFRFPVQLEIIEPAIGHTLYVDTSLSATTLSSLSFRDPPEEHVAALDLRNKPQDFDLYLEKSQRPYVRRKYWVETVKDDMDFLQQFDEERTDERLLNEDSNWLATSETLQRMSEEAWGELQDMLDD